MLNLTAAQAEAACDDCYFGGGRFDLAHTAPVDGATKLIHVDCGVPRCGRQFEPAQGSPVGSFQVEDETEDESAGAQMSSSATITGPQGMTPPRFDPPAGKEDDDAGSGDEEESSGITDRLPNVRRNVRDKDKASPFLLFQGWWCRCSCRRR